MYNRGVDRRAVFADRYDLQRFLQSMDEFNTAEPIGSIYEMSFLDHKIKSKKKLKCLVKFIAYCLNPNHYHFILQQAKDGGVSEFMKRLGGGYTWYFNHKHDRSGSLFQGIFKSKHIDTNEYLLHLSVYVNLNNRIHKLGGETAKLSKSSWEEYIQKTHERFCGKKIVTAQFNSPKEYEKFAENSLVDILDRKRLDKEFDELLIE